MPEARNSILLSFIEYYVFFIYSRFMLESVSIHTSFTGFSRKWYRLSIFYLLILRDDIKWKLFSIIILKHICSI